MQSPSHNTPTFILFYFVTIKNQHIQIFCANSKEMLGRTILVIVLSYLIAGKKIKMMESILQAISGMLSATVVQLETEEDNPTINFEGDIIPEVIVNPGTLVKEQQILREVEILYQVNRESIRSRRILGITKTKEEAFALVYITFLSFFEIVNFKVAFLHYSIVHFPNAEHLKSICDVYSRGLTKAFEQFKESLQKSIQLVPALYKLDGTLEHVAKLVVTLSTDLLMDVDYLINYKQKPDPYIPALINWMKVPIHREGFRSIFPSVSTVEAHVRAAINQGSEFNSGNVFKHIAKMVMNVFNWEALTNIQQSFTNIIIGDNSNELLTLNFIPAIFDKYLKYGKLPNFPDNDISVKCIIKRALELIYKLRSMDYAILHKRLPQ